jgi:hypothetical protein
MRIRRRSLLVVLSLAACVSRLPDQDRRILTAAPAARLSADLLWKDFQANAAAARRQYWGKAVVVTGTVTTIGPDAPTNRFIAFGQDDAHAIRAGLLDDEAAAIVNTTAAGKRITLKCFVEGLDGDLLLKSCVRP